MQKLHRHAMNYTISGEELTFLIEKKGKHRNNFYVNNHLKRIQYRVISELC